MSGAPPERGRFITLEGPEGSGKTTAARHLARVASRPRRGDGPDARARRHAARRGGPAHRAAHARHERRPRPARRRPAVRGCPRPARRSGHSTGTRAWRVGRLRALPRLVAGLPGRRLRQRPRRDAPAAGVRDLRPSARPHTAARPAGRGRAGADPPPRGVEPLRGHRGRPPSSSRCAPPTSRLPPRIRPVRDRRRLRHRSRRPMRPSA